MGSRYADMLREKNEVLIAKPFIAKVTDLEETDPYYFVALSETNAVLSEGELPTFKLRLPDEYLNKPFKVISRNRENLVAVIRF